MKPIKKYETTSTKSGPLIHRIFWITQSQMKKHLYTYLLNSPFSQIKFGPTLEN